MRHEDDDSDLRVRLPERPTSIPKTIGILNIVFGALLLLCVFCSSLNLMLQAALAPMMVVQQQQFQQAMQADRQQKLQKLQELEKAAQEEKAKAELRNQQKVLQAQPLPKMPDLSKFVQNSTFQGYMIIDVGTALVLNILMVIAGIGLVGRKEWARVTALWVAGVKIVRLIVLYTFYALVIVPIVVQQLTAAFQEMFDDMAKNAAPGQKMPGPADVGQLGTGMAVMMTVPAIGLIIFGVIYPAVVLLLLTRPQVKAVCAGTAPSSKRASGWRSTVSQQF
jgi:ABC-type multidrug transport system fused ATPase/permease subunit